ncbi:MAG: ABC transporter ATP-binding protein [Planctomycetia bacterium]|nr:ABC transporter ATP-binding protein [Planctomycetia bacterium]
MSEKNTHLFLDKVTRIYRSGKRNGAGDVKALDEITLRVPEGEFLAVMGASGSGKSTLLHVAAGLTSPTAGSVVVSGTHLEDLSDRQLTLFRRENIGIVFQAFNLVPTLTAEENILLPILAGGGKAFRENRAKMASAMDKILERLNLTERRTHYPDALSGGEQQRIAIARALFIDFLTDDARKTLLLADEPTGNLDSTNSEIICRLLRELCDERKHTMIVVTHESAVAKWADRVVTLRDGKILSDSSETEKKPLELELELEG